MKTNVKETERKYFTDTHQFDWTYNTHCVGCMKIAVEKILNGEIISFDCFKRGEHSTDMVYQGTKYIGLCMIDNKEDKGKSICLRISDSKDLEATGSNSIIPSWYDESIVKDPVIIAATICTRFKYYSDYFIN